jgi:hypothetical protein
MFYFSRQESRQGWWKGKRESWFTNSHNTSHVFWKVHLPSLLSKWLTATMTTVSLWIRTTVHSSEILTGLINSGFSWLWLCIFYQLYYILKLPSGSLNTVLSLKLLTNVENDTVFFRDSAHLKRYRNLAKSATTNYKIRVSKGYPRSHSNHCRSLVFTTVKTLACSHVNTKLNGSYNRPHTPINAHNLCKITGHLFYINCVHLLVMWVIIVTIRGRSGKYPAMFNISRTGRITLM